MIKNAHFDQWILKILGKNLKSNLNYVFLTCYAIWNWKENESRLYKSNQERINLLTLTLLKKKKTRFTNFIFVKSSKFCHNELSIETSSPQSCFVEKIKWNKSLIFRKNTYLGFLLYSFGKKFNELEIH